jgi:glycosyltransferase involved in cell wall biosynthesis
VVVNSPGFIEHVKKRGATDVRLVENGVDPAMFVSPTGGRVFRQQSGLEDDCVILYAGAHGISNDLEVMLEAANLTRHEPALKFVFVGDGKEKSRLSQRAAELKLTNVLFLPSVPKSEMAEVIAGADACLAILKPIEMYKTTYPNKVFDYMAAGKPVLLAIDGVIREVVEKANAGIFVEPGNPNSLANAALRIKGNPSEARRLGVNGQSYVRENFDRGILSEKFEGILIELKTKDHD